MGVTPPTGFDCTFSRIPQPQRIDLLQQCDGCTFVFVFVFIDLIDLFWGRSELCGPTPRKRCRTRGAHLGEGRTRMRGESHFRVMNSSALQEAAVASQMICYFKTLII